MVEENMRVRAVYDRLNAKLLTSAEEAHGLKFDRIFTTYRGESFLFFKNGKFAVSRAYVNAVRFFSKAEEINIHSMLEAQLITESEKDVIRQFEKDREDYEEYLKLKVRFADFAKRNAKQKS